jgi:hypothetical protein
MNRASEPPKNVVLHGALPTDQYVRIMQRADAGIGTLALHRNGMSEASPLKVREYLASGLPVIIGYTDTDFKGDQAFILKMPNTEENVRESMDGIRSFVTAWKGRRVERRWIEALDTRKKEAERLAFFQQSLNRAVL